MRTADTVIFKSAAAILAVEQRLLFRRFLILRSDNSSRLLHLSGLIVLAGSKSRGMLLLARDFLSCKLRVGVLYLPRQENYPRQSALIKA